MVSQTIARQLEKHVLKPMLAILATYMETRLNIRLLCCKVCPLFSKKKHFQNDQKAGKIGQTWR